MTLLVEEVDKSPTFSLSCKPSRRRFLPPTRPLIQNSQIEKMQNLTRKAVHTYRATLMKACCNHIPHQATPMKPVSVSDQNQSPWKTFGNPCLDMFHYLFPWMKRFPGDRSYDNYDYHLKRLLPHAWSYSPLTTLKIIRNLDTLSGPNDAPMSDALYWIHHNHPKTLAANLMPLLLTTRYQHQALVTILNRILDLKHVPGPWEMQDHVNEVNEAIKAGTTKGIREPLRILRNRVVYMYERDPNFRFLHDEVSHLFAESLKFDMQNFLDKVQDWSLDKDQQLEVTEAAQYCEGSPFLLESVARRVFPHVEDIDAAVELLRNEVLAPLKKVLSPDPSDVRKINIYGFSHHQFNESDPIRNQRRPALDLYLKDMSKSPEKMVAGALLPHELVEYVIGKNDGNVPRHAVELQWKAMVEDLKKRQLRVLNNSLAVIRCYRGVSELTGAMTILISELSEEEAWKGKFISMTSDPQLLFIEGHDLHSKCEFLQDPTKMLLPHSCFDCKKVLDLILQQAVNGSLKREQMIKKVFVFSFVDEFEYLWYWQGQDSDEMRNKYREHGYDIPQIVFWRPDDHLHTPFTDSPDERGLVAISGFKRAGNCGGDVNYMKMFLENDGHMSPQHVMESVLSDQDYRYSPPFVVLD